MINIQDKLDSVPCFNWSCLCCECIKGILYLSLLFIGQVVNVLREACTALSHQGPRYRAQLTSHITIPAAYKAGITLFVRQNTEVCQELFNAPELELKTPEITED